ncbi:DNA-binding protein [Candidatus Bathyarchaeota archaeon]|mgnify:CR=1 FL=1|nr:MAG: DNA-binding protein [Candidatus Bathyarchaeota archaeon]
MRISELKPGMRNVRLEAEVLEVGEPRRIRARGSERTILEAIITDGTGRVKLVLWDDKIIGLEPGDRVLVEGGVVTSYRGEWRLNVSRDGSVRKLGS